VGFHNRLSKSLADGSVPRSALALALAVEVGSTVGVATMLEFTPFGFFFLPKDTPQLLAKLARAPLADVPASAEAAANGDVRGTRLDVVRRR
jgi:hypothetical protein